MKFWSEEEIFRFLKYADKKYPFASKARCIYIAYLYDLETRVRARELWGIRKKDIPPTASSMTIARQLSATIY